MLALPRQVAPDHDEAPDPRPDDQERRHDEERCEHERHKGAVRGDREVVHLRRAPGQLERGARQCLHERHRGGHAEREDGDPEVGEREAAGADAHGSASSTISFADIRWWPSPQYSWHTIKYSPGCRNLVVNWLT